jgi:hypothetical protein
MTIPASVAAFIARQRDLLVRLELFAETPEYRGLLAVATPMADGDVEPWLAGVADQVRLHAVRVAH